MICFDMFLSLILLDKYGSDDKVKISHKKFYVLDMLLKKEIEKVNQVIGERENK